MPFAQSRRTPSRNARRDAGRFASALVLLALFPLPANPEPRQGDAGPDTADLRAYLECSVAAEARLLGFDEATFCSTVFMQIKLSFVPDIDLDTFNGLQPTEKSALDRLGYQRYLDWKERNTTRIDALMTEIRSSQPDS
jgi:hypothetical protein